MTNTFKAVICAAISELNNGIDDIFHFIGIDKMGHAKLTGEFLTCRINIDTNNFARPDHFCPLNDIQTNATQTKHHDIRACFYFSGKQHRAQTCGHTTAYIADFIKGCIRTNFG